MNPTGQPSFGVSDIVYVLPPCWSGVVPLGMASLLFAVIVAGLCVLSMAAPAPPQMPNTYNATMLWTSGHVKMHMYSAADYPKKKAWEAQIIDGHEVQMWCFYADPASDSRCYFSMAPHLCHRGEVGPVALQQHFLHNATYAGTTTVNRVSCDHWTGYWKAPIGMEPVDYYQETSNANPVQIKAKEWTLDFQSVTTQNIDIEKPSYCPN